jgi:hypothetical protein
MYACNSGRNPDEAGNYAAVVLEYINKALVVAYCRIHREIWEHMGLFNARCRADPRNDKKAREIKKKHNGIYSKKQ